MDDSNDCVRIETANTFFAMFSSISKWQIEMVGIQEALDPNDTSHAFTNAGGGLVESRLDDVHYEAIVKGLCLHLDDTNREVQEAVAKSFKQMRLIEQTKCIMAAHFEQIRINHRSPFFLNDILKE